MVVATATSERGGGVSSNDVCDVKKYQASGALTYGQQMKRDDRARDVSLSDHIPDEYKCRKRTSNHGEYAQGFCVEVRPVRE